jgi:hypothetical protein
MFRPLRHVCVAASLSLIGMPAAATVFIVNPAYAPGINGIYTQQPGAGPGGSGNYGVELRGGDSGGTATWEIGVGAGASSTGFFNQGQLNWGCGNTGPDGCGTIFDYVLTWRPATTPQTTAALSISLTPQGVTNPPTTTVVTPIGQGYAPLVGNTLRIWAKRDASFTVSEVDGRAFNVSRNGVPSGSAVAASDIYFFSPSNWGLDGLVAKGTLRIKGGGNSGREIFFTNGNFNPTAPYPEPDTWMLMIAGFGLVGGVMRRRRRAATA